MATKPRLAMFLGAPPKGCKQATMVLATRRTRSKWWEIVCFGQGSHYRRDGSCTHTDAMADLLADGCGVARERLRVADGRVLREQQERGC